VDETEEFENCGDDRREKLVEKLLAYIHGSPAAATAQVFLGVRMVCASSLFVSEMP
jgi:hypothetical protein